MDPIEFALKQAEYFATRWDTRKQYEWKTTTAVWALLGAGIYYKYEKRPMELPWCIAVLAVLVFAFGWLRTIWKANDFDKRMGRFYRGQAAGLMVRRIANLEPEPDLTVRWWGLGFLLDGSMLFQLLSVLALVLVFYLLPRPN